MPGFPGNAGIGKRRAYAAYSLVFACMLYRSTKLSEAPVWIAEESDDGETMLEGEHPLSELLERPNPDMSMAELLELLSLYDDATGGWLLVKNENRGGRVGSMYPYAFDEFSVEPANGRLYGRFRVQTLDGHRTLRPDQVIFRKRPSLGSLLDATSPMQAALAHVNIGDQMRTTIQQLLRRAIRPGSTTEVPGNLHDDQFPPQGSTCSRSTPGT
jgi:phage portal protein BeeE